MATYLLVAQRTKMDCAVATLASVTGNSYEKTLMAYTHPVYEIGAQPKQLREAATRLGFSTRLHRRIDLEDDEGILTVGSVKFGNIDHLVILNNGLIIDLDQPPSIWDADDYLKAFEAKPLSLITVKRQRRR